MLQKDPCRIQYKEQSNLVFAFQESQVGDLIC